MLLYHLLSPGLHSDVRFPAPSSSIPEYSHTNFLAREMSLMPDSYGSKTPGKSPCQAKCATADYTCALRLRPESSEADSMA